MSIQHEKKLFIIPGWMKSVGFYGDCKGLDIWKNNFNLNAQIDAAYIVGHSSGANFALINRSLNKNSNSKLILLNPLLPKKNFLYWIFQWMKFAFKGGIRVDKTMGIKQFFPALKNFAALLNFDPIKIIETIPKENLIIIRGSEDRFFCDDNAKKIIKEKNINLVEVDGLGHEWNENFLNAIKDVI